MPHPPDPPWHPFSQPGYGRLTYLPPDSLFAVVQASGMLRFSAPARQHLGRWVAVTWDAATQQITFQPVAADAGGTPLRGWEPPANYDLSLTRLLQRWGRTVPACVGRYPVHPAGAGLCLCWADRQART